MDSIVKETIWEFLVEVQVMDIEYVMRLSDEELESVSSSSKYKQWLDNEYDWQK